MFDIYIYFFLKSGFNQLDSWFWSVVKPMPKGFLYHFGSDLLQSNDPLGILLAGCQRFRRRSAPGFHLAISCGLQNLQRVQSRMNQHWKAWSMPGPQIPCLGSPSGAVVVMLPIDRLRIGSHRGLPGCSDGSWKIWRCCPSGRDRRGPSRSWSRIGWCSRCSPEGLKWILYHTTCLSKHVVFGSGFLWHESARILHSTGRISRPSDINCCRTWLKPCHGPRSTSFSKCSRLHRWDLAGVVLVENRID